jgi:hypothetical protein
MKKILATLSVVGLMVPSAAMAGSLRNDFGSEAMREVGSSVSATIAEVDNYVYREADFYFENGNESWNGSINAENFRVGGRHGGMAYGDETAAGGAAVAAEGMINAGGSYGEGDIVEPVLVKEKITRRREVLVYEPEVVGEFAEADLYVDGDGVAGGTASATSEYNEFEGGGGEGYKDGSVAWSVGGQYNYAHGDIEEEVHANTYVYSETLATSESYGYASDSYTSFSY